MIVIRICKTKSSSWALTARKKVFHKHKVSAVKISNTVDFVEHFGVKFFPTILYIKCSFSEENETKHSQVPNRYKHREKYTLGILIFQRRVPNNYWQIFYRRLYLSREFNTDIFHWISKYDNRLQISRSFFPLSYICYKSEVLL